MRALLTLLGIAILSTSCEKIVAEDITAETPVLILPAVNDTVDQNPVHFKWEELEGASKYHLEVVSPSFAAISEFALDSVVTGTDFYFNLDSNEYEMKLTAQNGGYDSQVLGPITFWVGVQPTGGTGNNVVLNSPTDQAYVNGLFNNEFSWTPIPGATSYEFSLRQGSSFSNGLIIDAQNGISTTTYFVPNSIVLSEGDYFWGVKAYFGSVESPFTINQLFVDETDPNVATPISPSDFSSMQQGTITFTWGNGVDVGTVQSPITSTLEISTDSGFGTIDQTIPLIGNTTDVNLPLGTYYWRVINEDEAGNSSGVSPTYQLTLTL